MGARRVFHKGEPRWVDIEGFALLKDGSRDRRFKRTLKNSLSRNERPRKSRAERVAELLDPETHDWTLLSEGRSDEGVKSDGTGAKLKRFYVIRDLRTGQELTLGRGEMEKYAKVDAPRKRMGRPRGRKIVQPDFVKAMADDLTT